jgi:two-component system KDP operon response regulator KdpE
MHPPHAATLLVIEPDPAIRAAIRATFAADGHRTIGAASLPRGIAALATARVDCILVDGDGVPAPGGWGALARLRAAAGATPIVILSASGAAPFAGYRARGFAGLVAKPGDADDLSTAVAPLLAARAAAAA